MNARPRPLHVLLIILLVLAGAFVLHSFPPEKHGFYPKCWLHEHTGLLCPGCGGTRALAHLLHGRWIEAFQSNAALLLSLPFAAFWLFRECRKRWRGEPAFQFRWSTRAVYGTLALLFLFAVIRNIPGSTTSWLRPPG